MDLTVDDGTGKCTAKLLGEDHDEDVPEIVVGHYYRLYAKPRIFDGVPSLEVFKVKPIVDHNEVVFHNLECIVAYQMATKKSQGVPISAVVGQGAGGMGGMSMGMSMGMNVGAGMGGMGVGGLGGNSCQQACLDIFNSDAANKDAGMADEELVAMLAGRFSKQEVLAAIRVLADEASIYCTVYDHHHKSINF